MQKQNSKVDSEDLTQTIRTEDLKHGESVSAETESNAEKIDDIDKDEIYRRLMQIVNSMINDFSIDFSKDFETERYVPSDLEIHELTDRIHSFINSYNDEIQRNSELLNELTGASDKINGLNAEIVELEENLKRYEQMLSERDRKIEEQNKMIADLNEDVVDLESKLDMNFWERLKFLFTGKVE